MHCHFEIGKLIIGPKYNMIHVKYATSFELYVDAEM